MDLATSEIYTLSLHDALPISIPDAERQSQQRPSWKSLVEPEATALPGRPTVELGSVPRVRQTQEPLRASSRSRRTGRNGSGVVSVTPRWPGGPRVPSGHAELHSVPNGTRPTVDPRTRRQCRHRKDHSEPEPVSPSRWDCENVPTSNKRGSSSCPCRA